MIGASSETTSHKRFIGATAAILLLSAAVVVYSAGEIYSPNPEGDWIRDGSKYAPGSNDQINVLGDLQPGAAEAMFIAGLRLNTLAAAGKKQNWDIAGHQAEEIEEIFDRLMITRPAMTTNLENFLSMDLEPVITAVTAQDKAAFSTAMDAMVEACTNCHKLYGEPSLVVKPGRSTAPLRF